MYRTVMLTMENFASKHLIFYFKGVLYTPMDLVLKQTYISYYFATVDGEIYSNKSGKLIRLLGSLSNKGYLTIHSSDGQCLIHRLVASAFLGDITSLTVNHINGIKTDNRVDNLEIVTNRENVQHAWKTGLSKKGEQHSRSCYSDEILLKALVEIKNGASVKQTAKSFGISQSYLNKVKNGVYRSELRNKVFV